MGSESSSEQKIHETSPIQIKSKTNENALTVFEKLLLYGFSNEQLAWNASNKFPNLNDLNQALDYIENQECKLKMDKMYRDYFRLLLKTRICILEEDSKCTLIDDESLSYKERINSYHEWIETDIIKSLITEWHSVSDRLRKEKIEWEHHDENTAQIAMNMSKMAKTMVNKLTSFQDVQNEMAQHFEYADHHKSNRKLKNALNGINNCLDSYVEEGKSVLTEATKHSIQKSDDSNLKTMRENGFFSFWNIFTCLSLKTEPVDPTQVFDQEKLEKIIDNEISTVYWLLLFNTRSKMKTLLIKCRIRKKIVLDFLKNNLNKNEFTESLFTLDSTICSYTGSDEWKAMQNAVVKLQNALKISSIMDTTKILTKHQNTLKNAQREISKNINEIEKCKTKETMERLLLDINTNLDTYIGNGQHILQVIEKASKQCFDNLY